MRKHVGTYVTCVEVALAVLGLEQDNCLTLEQIQALEDATIETPEQAKLTVEQAGDGVRIIIEKAGVITTIEP